MARNHRTCACECHDDMIRWGDVCFGADHCCPGEKRCCGGCIREQDCCTHTHKDCADGSCVPTGSCCPVLESPCPGEPSGCCPDGLACASDGCCPVSEISDVCNGSCTDLDTNDNCGACGTACGSCTACRRGENGSYACFGPNRNAPACEDCLEGEVVPAVSCGDRCCAVGTECCGNGCCAAGKCRVQNGQTCCLKVEDNRLVCKVL